MNNNNNNDVSSVKLCSSCGTMCSPKATRCENCGERLPEHPVSVSGSEQSFSDKYSFRLVDFLLKPGFTTSFIILAVISAVVLRLSDVAYVILSATGTTSFPDSIVKASDHFYAIFPFALLTLSFPFMRRKMAESTLQEHRNPPFIASFMLSSMILVSYIFVAVGFVFAVACIAFWATQYLIPFIASYLS